MDYRQAIITVAELEILSGALGCNESDDVRDVLTRLHSVVDSYEPGLVELAREVCRDGELEVDDGAVTSRGGDSGAYVQAWIWVDDPDDEDDVEDND